VYSRIYDGVTTVLHREFPALSFAAMCWTSFAPADFEFFLNRSNHASSAPWPPTYVTFHMYAAPWNMFGGVQGGWLGLEALLASAKLVVAAVNASSGGATKVFVVSAISSIQRNLLFSLARDLFLGYSSD
jgi:hypothetical protein